MYCRKCGNELPEGSSFCNKCGASVIVPDSNSDAAPDTNVELAQFDLQETKQGAYIEKLKKFFQKSSSKWAAIGIGVVILAFIIGIVVHNHNLRLMQLTIIDAVSQEIVAEKMDIGIRKGFNNYEGVTYKHMTIEESEEIIPIKLPHGDYTLEVSCNGYITGYCQVNLETNEDSEDNDIVQEECYLTPQPQEDQLAVVLTWNNDNEDLDLIIYTSDETENSYSSFIGSRMLSDAYGNYMLSDNNSKYEVAYITETDSHTIYVSDYTEIQDEKYDGDEMADSFPRLCVYGSEGLLIAYDFPTGEQGVVWKAARISEGNAIEINQLFAETVGDEWWLRDKQEKLLVKETQYDSEGNINRLCEYTYDAIGNEIKYVRNDADGSESLKESVYDENGNEIQRIIYNDEGDITSQMDCTYDDYGVLVKYTLHDSDGILEDIYDEDGNVVKETSYGNDGNLEYWGEANYNSAGDVTKSVVYYSDGSIRRVEEHTYDSKGNLTKVYVHDEEQEIDDWTEMTYVYDENDNETEVITYDSSGEIQRTEKSYNSDGNLINSISYDSQGIISIWHEYDYDANGNRNIEIYKDSDGKILSQIEYENEKEVKTVFYNSDGSVNDQIEYSYDEEGDVIRYTHYDGEGNITYWTEYIYDEPITQSNDDNILEELDSSLDETLTGPKQTDSDSAESSVPMDTFVSDSEEMAVNGISWANRLNDGWVTEQGDWNYYILDNFQDDSSHILKENVATGEKNEIWVGSEDYYHIAVMGDWIIIANGSDSKDAEYEISRVRTDGQFYEKLVLDTESKIYNWFVYSGNLYVIISEHVTASNLEDYIVKVDWNNGTYERIYNCGNDGHESFAGAEDGYAYFVREGEDDRFNNGYSKNYEFMQVSLDTSENVVSHSFLYESTEYPRFPDLWTISDKVLIGVGTPNIVWKMDFSADALYYDEYPFLDYFDFATWSYGARGMNFYRGNILAGPYLFSDSDAIAEVYMVGTDCNARIIISLTCNPKFQ